MEDNKNYFVIDISDTRVPNTSMILPKHIYEALIPHLEIEMMQGDIQALEDGRYKVNLHLDEIKIDFMAKFAKALSNRAVINTYPVNLN
jgi:hypothetical protein